MHVYADTSILFALCFPDDPFFRAVNRRTEAEGPTFFYPPLLRFEVRHALTLARGEKHGETGWRALQAAEKCFVGVQENWLAVVELSGELSARHGRKIQCGGVDVLHVASAVRLGASEFWTGDRAQAELARAAGLKVVDFSKRVAS